MNMKKISATILCLIVLLMAESAHAQESVTEAQASAEKMLKKVNNSRFKDFKKSYAQALLDMEQIEKDAPNSEFGYDALADALPGWIKLNKTLQKFPEGSVSTKKESITFTIKDYLPLLDEASAKAAEANFKAGVKIKDNNTTFEERQKSFNHFEKAQKYSKEYSEKVKEYKAEIYYDEAVKLSKSATNFEEKLKAGNMFKNANNDITPFKNSVDLAAKMFYDEAVKLSKSNDLKDLTQAYKSLAKTNEWVKNYNGYDKLKLDIANKGAEIVYQTALTKEKERTFEAQAEAAKLFESTESWVKNYKDAAKRAEMAKERSEVNVLVVETDGSLIYPNAFEYQLQSKTNKNISTPSNLDAIKELDMNKSKNYVTAKEKLGYGFILIKLGSGSIDYSYMVAEPVVTTTDVSVYYSFQTDAVTNKVTEKKISKNDYDNAKKAQKLLGNTGGVVLKEYAGELIKTTLSAKVTGNFSVEIWDVRKPDAPINIRTIDFPNSISDNVTTSVFKGEEKARPANLSSDTRNVKSEETMLKEANDRKPSIKLIVKNNLEKFTEALNEEIKFRAL